MDDFGGNGDYGLKILIGTIIGVILILFLVPLGANIIATEEAASPNSDVFDSVDNSNSVSALVIPIDLSSIENTNISFIDNSTNTLNKNITKNTNNTEYNNSIIDNSNNNETINQNNSIAENTYVEDTDDVQTQQFNDVSNMKILSGSITTGSGLNDKSRCVIYVGSEYAGEHILMSTLYSRDGSNLNQGRQVSVTVDSSGHATLTAADSYDLYPSNCVITIYSSSGNTLDSRSVSLTPDSGTQSF